MSDKIEKIMFEQVADLLSNGPVIVDNNILVYVEIGDDYIKVLQNDCDDNPYVEFTASEVNKSSHIVNGMILIEKNIEISNRRYTYTFTYTFQKLDKGFFCLHANKLIASVENFNRMGFSEINQPFAEDRGKIRSFQEKFLYDAYNKSNNHNNRDVYITYHMLDPKKYGRDNPIMWSAELQVRDKDEDTCIDIRISQSNELDINKVRSIANKIANLIFTQIF